MVHCLMEMKMTNLQRENQIRFAEISLQQLKVVFSSLYGHHVRVYMPVNIGKTMDGFVEGSRRSGPEQRLTPEESQVQLGA